MRIKIVNMVQFRDGILALSEEGDLYWGRFDVYVGEITWTLMSGPRR